MLKGLITKMDVENTFPVQYSFRIDSEKISLNNLSFELTLSLIAFNLLIFKQLLLISIPVP